MWNIQNNKSDEEKPGATVSRGSGGNATPSRTSSRGSGGFPASRGSGSEIPPAVKKGYVGIRSSGSNIPAAAPNSTERHSTTVGSAAETAAHGVLAKMSAGKAAPSSARRSSKGRREEVTPGKRKALIAGAICCLFAAVGLTFVLPHSTEDEEAAATVQPHFQNDVPPEDPRRNGAFPLARNAAGAGGASSIVEQRPFKVAYRIASGGPEEQLKVINKYLIEGSADDKVDAYAALLDMNEWIAPRLADLIRTEKSAALVAYANAAAKLKIAGAVDAAIEKLQTNEQAGRFELFQMLAQSDAPKAHDFIWSALANSSGPDNGTIWKAVGPFMSDADADNTLKIVASMRTDAGDAAVSLGTCAKSTAKADRIGRAVEELIRKGDVNRSALMDVLTNMDPTIGNFYVDAFTSDPDEQLRATALGALARDRHRYAKALYALQHDPSKVVKSECARGFIGNQSEEVLRECILLLNDPDLSTLAHEVLIKATKHEDLGWKAFAWYGWLSKRKAAAAAAARGKS